MKRVSQVFVVVSCSVCLEVISSIPWVFSRPCRDPRVQICFVSVSIVWHVVISEVFVCMCVGGQEWQSWKTKFSWVVPLLLVVEKAGFPPAAFPEEEFSCLCVLILHFGFFFTLMFVSTWIAFSYPTCRHLGLVSLPGILKNQQQ